MKLHVALLLVTASPLLCLVVGSPTSSQSRYAHGIHYWDLLMDNPAGTHQSPPAPVEPACTLSDGDQNCVPGSTNPAECCGEGFCYDARPPFCCTKSDDGGPCTGFDGGQCCGGQCQQAGGTECGFGCFSRNTKVMTQEVSEPVAVRDLEVGQHVLCYEGGLDMSTPGRSAWCMVKNFLRADDETVYPDMVRLTVRAVDDSISTTTVVSWVHIMHLVTDIAPRQQAATPAELGEFVHEIAMNTKAGQLVAMPTSSGLNATFKLGAIERVEVIEETGKYIPAIEHPFIWADGLVQPIWAAWFRKLGDNGQHGITFPVGISASNAFRHMLNAPVWMTAIQPKGTPGRHAKWDGDQYAPLMKTLSASLQGNGDAPVYGAANFTRALEWFVPRYQAWKADPSQATTEADVLEVFPSMFADSPASCPLSAESAGCANQEVFCYSRSGLRPLHTALTSV